MSAATWTATWTDRPVPPAVLPLGPGAGLGLLDLVAVVEASRSAPVLLCDPDCLRAVVAHLAGAPVELGGLLVGRAWSLAPEDPAEPVALLRVEEAVPSRDSDSTARTLRMDVELWSRAQDAAARRGGTILGWYHSHPDLGAFFSPTDRRTQAAAFRNPWSLGLVIDPVRGEERWFLGPHCRELRRACQSGAPPASVERTAQEHTHEDR